MNRRGWLRRALSRLRRWIAAAPGNIALGLLSVALAAFVWVAITTSENPTDNKQFVVRVEPDKVPDEYQASNPAPDKVTVIVTAPRNVLRTIRADEVIARVDLSGVAAEGTGQPEFSVTRTVKAELRGRNDRRIKAESQTEQVKVTLELLERREVRVDVRRVGVLPVGYEISEISPPEPAKVVVEGTRPNLNAVESVSADVKLDGLTASVPLPVVLEPRNAAGRTIGGVTVQPATATVKVSVKQVLFPKQVVVSVRSRGSPKTGYRASAGRPEPPTVTVLGPLEQINALPAVPTEEIDIEGADRDVVRSIRLQLPQGVTASQQSVIATIPIQVVPASAPVGVVPRVVNIGPGLTAQLVTPIVALTFRGPLGDLAQLRPTDVSVTVDASGLGAGTHRLEPKVTFPSTLQLDAVVPDRVEVILR